VIVSVNPRALVRELDGEAVVLDLDSGMYYGLNAVGTWIWNRASASGGLPFAALVAELVEEFDVVPPVAERDASAFIEALRTSRLVHVRR
jgi:Coenzyme PQQ synthesis protein D (PqqD)